MNAEEIKDRQSFSRWLNGLPDPLAVDAGDLLIRRAALRVLPLVEVFAEAKGIHGQAFSSILKTCFWRAILLNSQNRETWERIEWRALSQLQTQSFKYASTYKIEGAIESYVALSNGLAAVTSGYSDGLHSRAIWELHDAVDSYCWLRDGIKDNDLFLAFWSQVRLDASRAILGDGSFDKSVFHRPLFEDAPVWWIGTKSFHQVLSNDELGSDQWDIWVDWYENLSLGLPPFGLKNRDTAEALERNIALGSRDGTFNEAFWKREPREINAEIAEWVAQERAKEGRVQTHPPLEVDDALPKQDVTAVTFGLTDDGRIDRLPAPPEHRLLITPSQQREYAATRADAEALAGLGQQLGKLAAEVAALRSAMPEDMGAANVFDLWRAINRLRRTFNAHERVRDLTDPHEARLEPAVAEELGHLLDTANNFGFGDPGLRRRDENAIPPQDRPSLEEEGRLGAPLVSVIINTQGVLTADAEAVVKAEEENGATAGDDPHGLQAQDQRNKTRRNLIAATLDVLKRVSPIEWAEFKKEFSKKVAGGTYTLIMTYIIANIPAVQAFARLVWNSPALNKLLDALAKMVAGV